jgi:hypothetical protein
MTRSTAATTISVEPVAPSRGTAWSFAFGASLALFVATLAPDVLMMDSGEYQVAVHHFPRLDLGERPDDLVRVHPVYLAAAKLVSLIPVRSLAWRVNLVSALFGALAVANAVWLTMTLTRDRRSALLTGLVLCLGHTLWAFAVIAEVMTMVAAFATLELICWARFLETRRTRWLAALALINGLGVATHLQLGLNTLVHTILYLQLARRNEITLRFITGCAAIWLLGTLPYSGLVLYYGFQTGDWPAILRSATLGQYGTPITHTRPLTLLRGLASVLLNYPTLLIVFAVPAVRRLARAPFGPVAYAMLGVATIQFVFAMTYRVPDQYSFFLPFYAVAAVMIGAGAQPYLSQRKGCAALCALAALPPVIYAAAAPAMRALDIQFFQRTVAYRDPYDFFIKPWQQGNTGQRRYIEEAFAILPDGALLLTSETTRSMLEYGQRVDGLRPDVVIFADPRALASNIAIDGPVARWTRPVWATDAEAKKFPSVLREHCRLRREGPLWEIEPPGDPAAFIQMLAAK